MTRHAVTVIPGDGIGPECVQAAIDVVNASGVGIDWIERHAGERVFKQGIASRMPQVSRDPVFRPAATKEVVGADIFVESGLSPAELGGSLEAISAAAPLTLKMISNRGTKVYPDGNPNIDCVSHHRCRFVSRSGKPIRFDQALDLARRINETHEVCHVERLLRINGADGFTKAQGED
jgi:isocitrate dehydrogenase